MVEVISFQDDVQKDEFSHAYGQGIEFINAEDLEIAIAIFKSQHDLSEDRVVIKEERLSLDSYIIITNFKDESSSVIYLLLKI